MKPLLDTVESLKRDTQGLTDERTDKAILDNVAAVEESHPDYADIRGSDEFYAWYEDNKGVDFIREAVERNAEKCVNPKEVSTLLKMFKADTGWKPPAKAGETTGDGKGQGKGQSAQGNGKTGAEGQSQTQTREQTRTELRRENQLDSSASPRTTGVGSVYDGAPDDPKQAWTYWRDKGL